MAATKRRPQLGNLKSLPPSKYRAIAPKPAGGAASRDLRTRKPVSPKVVLRDFKFEELPEKARYRIYHYLGFPMSDSLELSTDVLSSRTNMISLRQLYKVDLTTDKSLSVPWNYERNRGSKRATPEVGVSMLCLNRSICDELHEALYGNSLFVVHTPNFRRPETPALSDQAMARITHVAISFNAIDATKKFFEVPTYHEALIKTINAVKKTTPSLLFFAINFWSVQLHSGNDINASDSYAMIERERPDFRNTLFLNTTLLDLTRSHPKINTFALLRNMQPRGALNWARDKDTARKSLSRDLKKCMSKVYNDQRGPRAENH